MAWWERARVEDQQDDGVHLAHCLLVGKGTRPGPTRARRMLATTVRTTTATAWDHEWAMALLGVTSASGLGTALSLARARMWLEHAVADGDYPAAERVLDALGERDPTPDDVARSGLFHHARGRT